MAMRELMRERVRTAVTSILGGHKTGGNRPFIGRYVQQAMLGGLRIAPMMPLYGLVVWAIGDYEGLRHFLVTATSAEMSHAVLSLIVAGFFMGGFIQVLIDATTPNLTAHGVSMERLERRDTEVWFWAQQPEGRELAIREVTTARCSPNADVRWAIDDLLKELERPENKAGSDLLDHKVMKLLGIPSQALKPTQKLDDAKRLLAIRYRGMPSRYEWDAKTEQLVSGFKAFITVRVPAKSSDMEPQPWQRCLVTDGPSEALAVTIAAMTRETWTFTT
ncbi:hypothetical protein ABCV69_004500 [Pseudomonas aeruginosa]|nr:hypothetical protein [[Pseudomonas] sp. BICA1-14]KJS79048.1 MAG: hypothetical protein JL55_13590 [[Pseudomonas] sp. BICA1-14]HBN9859409.1 hypothetical protein [Pseudomonas aeruginosa]HBO8078195.1 hypothetical protein [Pseudomonas aeruginosa]HBO8799793.1 hypothetical protein [Pseudomonas aeruginosa]